MPAGPYNSIAARAARISVRRAGKSDGGKVRLDEPDEPNDPVR